MKKVLLFTLILLCFSSFIYAREFTCETNEDCSEGKICVEGTCQEIEEPECYSDEDCIDGICVDGYCQEIEEPECYSNEDCNEGETCIEGICQEIDSDSDGMLDIEDNCPSIPNPYQEDVDGDDIGDVCDELVGEYDQNDNTLYLYENMILELENLTVEIPANITITGDVNWTGVVNAPSIKEIATVSPEIDSGYTGTVNQIIEIGFPDVKLVFDKAVKVLIPDAAGKLVGYARTGEPFHKIINVCGEDSQVWADTNLLAEGDCKIDVGSDLVVWTKHFTEFITYTQTQNPPSSNSGEGGSSSKKLPSIPVEETVKETCEENWICDAWSDCVSGEQRRDCEDVNDCGMIADKPAVVRKCVVPEPVNTVIEEETVEEPESPTGITGMITRVTDGVAKNSRVITIISVLFGLVIIIYLAKGFLFKK